MNAPSSTTSETSSQTSREKSLWIILGGFGVLMLCVCCLAGLMYTAVFGSMVYSVASAPTATRTMRLASATGTRGPIQTIPATRTVVTPRTTPTPTATLPIIFSETFDNNFQGWQTGEYDGKFASGSRTIANGKYRWDVTAKDGVLWGSNPDSVPVADFVVTVDAEQIECIGDCAYGISFREDRFGNKYVFEVANKQYYSVAVKKDDVWRTLIDWTKSSVINTHGLNRLSVKAEGSRLTFSINDRYVDQIEDKTLADGRCGVVTDLNERGDHGVIEFDNFQVWSPINLASPTAPRVTATNEAQNQNLTPQQAQTLLSTSHSWNSRVYDFFASNSNQWLTGAFTSTSLTGSRNINSGSYHWSFKSDSTGIVPSIATNTLAMSDGALSVDCKALSGASDVSTGLIFRALDQNNFYVFRITNDGYYAFQIQINPGLQTIGNWVKTSAIHPNETNRLTVIAGGTHFFFYVNDEFVGQADDTRFSTGKVGIVVGNFGESSNNVVEFDNFEIRAP